MSNVDIGVLIPTLWPDLESAIPGSNSGGLSHRQNLCWSEPSSSYAFWARHHDLHPPNSNNLGPVPSVMKDEITKHIMCYLSMINTINNVLCKF